MEFDKDHRRICSFRPINKLIIQSYELQSTYAWVLLYEILLQVHSGRGVKNRETCRCSKEFNNFFWNAKLFFSIMSPLPQIVSLLTSVSHNTNINSIRYIQYLSKQPKKGNSWDSFLFICSKWCCWRHFVNSALLV